MIIKLETAKLAKELGFKLKCIYAYDRIDMLCTDLQGGLTEINYNSGGYMKSAPEQSLLAEWLREEHKIRVFPTQGASGGYNYEIYKWNYDNQLGKWEKITNISSENEYEIIFEKGLNKALDILKERQNG